MVAGVASWFVYVARCSDGSLYVGIARDVPARIAAHNAGRGARYTRGRGPLETLASRRCPTQGDALRLARPRLRSAASRPHLCCRWLPVARNAYRDRFLFREVGRRPLLPNGAELFPGETFFQDPREFFRLHAELVPNLLGA
jgi:putative endonuclease